MVAEQSHEMYHRDLASFSLRTSLDLDDDVWSRTVCVLVCVCDVRVRTPRLSGKTSFFCRTHATLITTVGMMECVFEWCDHVSV